MINWIKAGVTWVFSNKFIAIKYLKMGLDVASYVSKQTKTTKDDVGVAYVANTVSKAIEFLPNVQKKMISNRVNSDNGSLKDLNLNYDVDSKELVAKIKDKEVKISLN